MTLWLMSADATNSDVKFSEHVRLCIRKDIAPTHDEAEAWLSRVGQAAVRGARGGQDWPIDLTDVTVVEQPQIGITGSQRWLSDRLAVHLEVFEPVLINGDDSNKLAGIDLLFMARSAQTDNRRRADRDFLEAAARAGVRHVVLVSSADAAAGAVSVRGADAFDSEQALRESGMSFTILRLNLTVDEILALPDAGGVIRGSGGDGQIALVSHFDITRISTLILNRPHEHLGQTYTLTGPESLSLTEITERLQSLLNRPLNYVDTPSTHHADILAAISMGAFREASIDVEMIGRWEPRKVEQASDIF